MANSAQSIQAQTISQKKGWLDSFRLMVELTRFELILNISRSRLGWLWWFLDPLIMIGVFGIFKGILLGGDSYQPYFIFVGCALLCWKFISTAVLRSTSLLRSKEPLIKAFPFPTWVLPCALVLEQLVFFNAGMILLISVAVFIGQSVGLELMQLVPLTFLTIVLTLGSVLLCSTLGVFSTALGQYAGHFIRIVWLLSPGMYGTDLIAKQFGENSWQYHLFLLNPIALIFKGFRSALFEPQWIPASEWLTLSSICSVLLVAGVLVFTHYNRRLIKHF